MPISFTPKTAISVQDAEERLGISILDSGPDGKPDGVLGTHDVVLRRHQDSVSDASCGVQYEYERAVSKRTTSEESPRNYSVFGMIGGVVNGMTAGHRVAELKDKWSALADEVGGVSPWAYIHRDGVGPSALPALAELREFTEDIAFSPMVSNEVRAELANVLMSAGRTVAKELRNRYRACREMVDDADVSKNGRAYPAHGLAHNGSFPNGMAAIDAEKATARAHLDKARSSITLCDQHSDDSQWLQRLALPSNRERGPSDHGQLARTERIIRNFVPTGTLVEADITFVPYWNRIPYGADEDKTNILVENMLRSAFRKNYPDRNILFSLENLTRDKNTFSASVVVNPDMLGDQFYDELKAKAGTDPTAFLTEAMGLGVSLSSIDSIAAGDLQQLSEPKHSNS